MNINPGQSTTLTAVPLDSTGAPTKLPAGDVPNWSASNSNGVSMTPSADGLSLVVAMGLTAQPGDYVFTITDAKIATATGSITLTVPAPVPNPVASFSVTASTPA
jgi:hypothetical protein